MEKIKRIAKQHHEKIAIGGLVVLSVVLAKDVSKYRKMYKSQFDLITEMLQLSEQGHTFVVDWNTRLIDIAEEPTPA